MSELDEVDLARLATWFLAIEWGTTELCCYPGTFLHDYASTFSRFGRQTRDASERQEYALLYKRLLVLEQQVLLVEQMVEALSGNSGQDCFASWQAGPYFRLDEPRDDLFDWALQLLPQSQLGQGMKKPAQFLKFHIAQADCETIEACLCAVEDCMNSTRNKRPIDQVNETANEELSRKLIKK